MSRDEYDKRIIENLYCTAEDIDERQENELKKLMEQWQRGELTPQDMLMQTAIVTGARPEFLLSYHSAIRYGPGSEEFTRRVEAERQAIIQRYERFWSKTLLDADATLQWIEQIKQADARFDREGTFLKQKELRDQDLIKDPGAVVILDNRNDVMGSSEYCTAVQKMRDAYEQAKSGDDKLIQVICENRLLHMHISRAQVEWDYNNIDESHAREVQKLHDEIQKKIDALKEKIRPEILDENQAQEIIAENVELVRARLESGEFSSWDAARAIAEIILRPELDEDKQVVISDDRDDQQIDLIGMVTARPKTPIASFIHSLERSKRESGVNKTDPRETMKLFEPSSEDEVKKPMALLFAEERAYQSWRTEQLAAGKTEGQSDRWTYYTYGCPGCPEEGDECVFDPPIEYPDKKLCTSMYIEPSGTALIEVLPRDYEDLRREGNVIARITTYSLRLGVNNPEDAQLLQSVVHEALRVLGDVPYDYDLPDWTPSGKGYIRPTGTRDHYHSRSGKVQNPHIMIDAENRIEIDIKLDLDDLYKLYYLLEPIIEPTEQIAAAMNAARYAEERGAPMEKQLYSSDFEVEDHVGAHIGGLDAEDILHASLQRALIDFALYEIDAAEFLARITTLSDQTLTGQLTDGTDKFRPFRELLDDATGSDAVTYPQAQANRVRELMKEMLGIEIDEDVDLHLALIGATDRIRPQVRRYFQDAAESREDEMDATHRKHALRYSTSLSFGFDELARSQEQRTKALKLSDILRNGGIRTAEDIHKEREDGVAFKANIVPLDSEVETCLDGIHHGRYMSRLRGSPLVRHKLPSALESFCSHDHRPGANPVFSLMNAAP